LQSAEQLGGLTIGLRAELALQQCLEPPILAHGSHAIADASATRHERTMAFFM
jgi:hypothetical protein